MSDLFQDLKHEFQDEDYRYAYAESFLNTKLATQTKVLREQRGLTQAAIASKMGIKQPGYRRFEDVNHSVWKTDSLWTIARALGVRLNVSFETFGTLPEEKRKFTRDSLERPDFKEDPAFKEYAADSQALAAAGANLSTLMSTSGANSQFNQAGLYIVRDSNERSTISSQPSVFRSKKAKSSSKAKRNHEHRRKAFQRKAAGIAEHAASGELATAGRDPNAIAVQVR